jgi:multiple sugar transport system substrate-binding protein
MFMRRKLVFTVLLSLMFSMAMVWAGGEQASSGKSVTIEFLNWWQLELPDGTIEKIVGEFEANNPNIKIKLINVPNGEMLNQLAIGSASATLPDVLALDPKWAYDLVNKQKALESLDEWITKDTWDLSQLSTIFKLNNKIWMMPAVIYIQPLFYNVDHFKAAGLADYPKTQEEFLDYARKLTVPSKNQYGFVVPMSLNAPNGVKYEFLYWAWAYGKYGWKDDLPNLVTPEVKDAINFVATMYKENLLVPGSFTKNEAEKIEDFTAGRASMMVSTTALINTIKNRNPNLNFDICPMPTPTGYAGKNGLSIATWQIGMPRASKNNTASWEFIKYILNQDVNSYLSSHANGFAGNKFAKLETLDPRFAKAFDMFQEFQLVDEFMGQPNANGLQRLFMEQVHFLLEGKQSLDDTVKNAQAAWIKEYGK